MTFFYDVVVVFVPVFHHVQFIVPIFLFVTIFFFFFFLNITSKLFQLLYCLQIVKLTGKQGRRNAFSINVAHRSINSMVLYYKNKMCPPGTFIETNKSINVVNWPKDTIKWY